MTCEKCVERTVNNSEYVDLCALHGAAGELLEVLQRRVIPVLDWLESYEGTVGASTAAQVRAYAVKAIAKAEGQ